MLILPEFQNRGIGSNLIRLIEEKYPTVRQIILIADNDENLYKFYSKDQYVNLNKYSINGYGKFK